jgi:imidazolonepropionase-like amidohydrolase
VATLVAGATLAARQEPVQDASVPLVITGARILDPAGARYLPAPVIVVDKGKIVSVGSAEPAGLSSDVERLDAAGSTLVPGLVDAHAGAAPSADLDADYFARLALGHGVTAVRALNLRTTWATSQRRRVDQGLVLGPRLFVGGRGIDQGARPDLWLLDAADAAAASAEAARQVEARVDWIAGYDHLTPDIVAALVAAARGTTARVSGVPGASSMRDLAVAGVHAIDGLEWPLAPRKNGDAAAADRAWIETPARDLQAFAAALVASKVTLVPMLAARMPGAFPADVAKDPSLALLPAARRDAVLARAKTTARADVDRAARAWKARAAFLARFVKAGGRVATGTGASAVFPVPGAGVHTELAALVRAGLTPADAIRAATTDAAALLGAEASVGQIAAGRDADFFIVNGDPLADVAGLAGITHVVRRGVVRDPKALVRAVTRGPGF